MANEDDEDDLFELYHSSGNERDRPKAPQEDPREDPPFGDNSGDSMDDLEVNDLLTMGRRLLLTDLLKAIKGGYASPQEKAILAKMLKDNGMVMGDPLGEEGHNGTPRKQPLPTFDKPDYETP